MCEAVNVVSHGSSLVRRKTIVAGINTAVDVRCYVYVRRIYDEIVLHNIYKYNRCAARIVKKGKIYHNATRVLLGIPTRIVAVLTAVRVVKAKIVIWRPWEMQISADLTFAARRYNINRFRPRGRSIGNEISFCEYIKGRCNPLPAVDAAPRTARPPGYNNTRVTL